MRVDMFFCSARLPVAGPAGGKAVPTVAAGPGIYLMLRNGPGCQEKPGKGDSHGCYTRGAA